MIKKQMMSKENGESMENDIKRKTRRRFTADEKIKIVLEVLKGQESIAEICRKEDIAPPLYYRWSKDFIEGGKRQLLREGQPTASTSEFVELREENSELKKALAEEILKGRGLEKRLNGSE